MSDLWPLISLLSVSVLFCQSGWNLRRPTSFPLYMPFSLILPTFCSISTLSPSLSLSLSSLPPPFLFLICLSEPSLPLLSHVFSCSLQWHNRGESYLDVIARIEPIIMEMERHREPLLIVGHQGKKPLIRSYNLNMRSTWFRTALGSVRIYWPDSSWVVLNWIELNWIWRIDASL